MSVSIRIEAFGFAMEQAYQGKISRANLMSQGGFNQNSRPGALEPGRGEEDKDIRSHHRMWVILGRIRIESLTVTVLVVILVVERYDAGRNLTGEI